MYRSDAFFHLMCESENNIHHFEMKVAEYFLVTNMCRVQPAASRDILSQIPGHMASGLCVHSHWGWNPWMIMEQALDSYNRFKISWKDISMDFAFCSVSKRLRQKLPQSPRVSSTWNVDKILTNNDVEQFLATEFCSTWDASLLNSQPNFRWKGLVYLLC